MNENSPRRRRRAQRPAGPAISPVGQQPAAENADRTPEPSRGRAKAHRRSDDRGWRDLAGSSPSQVGISGALRARDVARPDESDLATAERELVIVRRQWSPPEQA